MAAVGPLKYLYLAHFSKPKPERILYSQLKKLAGHRIVEVGIGNIQRAVNLVNVARRFSGDKGITYTGLDLFEERPVGQSPLPLIHAHRQLQLSGAKARLVPGFPPATLPQVANSLQRTDLLIISGMIDDADLERTWFYLPRMCQSTTLVLRERLNAMDEVERFEPLTLAELEQRAMSRAPRRAA